MHYSFSTFITSLFMKLVKGCKVCHEQLLKSASPSSKPSSSYVITWVYKAWLKLMQLGTSAIKMFPQDQRWNLVSINILVAYEYKNSYIPWACTVPL